jgi:hypothetical protein
MNRKTQIEQLEKIVSNAQSEIAQQEVIWMREWEAAPNPFVAINEWNKNHDRRMVYIQPWLDAKAELNKFKSKK